MKYPDTQIESWESLQEKLPQCRRDVLRVVKDSGAYGISTVQISNTLGWPINCVSGRLTELKKSGVIQDSGRRCVNPSGKKGILWIFPVAAT